MYRLLSVVRRSALPSQTSLTPRPLSLRSLSGFPFPNDPLGEAAYEATSLMRSAVDNADDSGTPKYTSELEDAFIRANRLLVASPSVVAFDNDSRLLWGEEGEMRVVYACSSPEVAAKAASAPSHKLPEQTLPMSGAELIVRVAKLAKNEGEGEPIPLDKVGIRLNFDYPVSLDDEFVSGAMTLCLLRALVQRVVSGTAIPLPWEAMEEPAAAAKLGGTPVHAIVRNGEGEKLEMLKTADNRAGLFADPFAAQLFRVGDADGSEFGVGRLPFAHALRLARDNGVETLDIGPQPVGKEDPALTAWWPNLSLDMKRLGAAEKLLEDAANEIEP